jgi:hypothetical protein
MWSICCSSTYVIEITLLVDICVCINTSYTYTYTLVLVVGFVIGRMIPFLSSLALLDIKHP